MCGSFADDYLELPEEVLITPMREHQRYFPVRDASGKLMAKFITVRNGTAEHLDLVREVREAVTLPLTVLGGAGSLKDIETLIQTFGIIGAAAGSLFVFKGVYRAVLINYPNRAEKDALIQVAA